MAQSPATANQNGFIRKSDEMNTHLSSSPRRTAIGKPSLRLSIPTIEQIAETKNQAKFNQTDPADKKSESFVKRMIDNCNHSGQLHSNIDGLANTDGQPNNIENVAEICGDTNRVKSVIEKLDKSKRTNSTNGRSPTEILNTVANDVSKKLTTHPNFEVTNESNSNSNSNSNSDAEGSEETICAIDSNDCPQMDNFPSYSKFENDFKKRMNEFNAGRFDAHGRQLCIFFTQKKKLNFNQFHFNSCFAQITCHYSRKWRAFRRRRRTHLCNSRNRISTGLSA